MTDRESRPKEIPGYVHMQSERTRLTRLFKSAPEKMPGELSALVLTSPITNEAWLKQKGVKAGTGDNLFMSVVALAFANATRSPEIADRFLETLDASDEVRQRLQLDLDDERQSATPIPLIDTIAGRVASTPDADPDAREMVSGWIRDKQTIKTARVAEIKEQRYEKTLRWREDGEHLQTLPSLDEFWPAFGAFTTEYKLNPVDWLITYHKFRQTKFEEEVATIQQREKTESQVSLTQEQQLPESCTGIEMRTPRAVLSYETLDQLVDDLEAYHYPTIPESAGVPEPVRVAIADNQGGREEFDKKIATIREEKRYPRTYGRGTEPLVVYESDGKYHLQLTRLDEPHRVGWGNPSTEEFAKMMSREESITYDDYYPGNPTVIYKIKQPLNFSDPEATIIETSLRPKELATHFSHIAGLTPEETDALAEKIIVSCGEEWQPGKQPQEMQAENGLRYAVEPNSRLGHFTYNEETDRMVYDHLYPLDYPEVAIKISGGTPAKLKEMKHLINALHHSQRYR